MSWYYIIYTTKTDLKTFYALKEQIAVVYEGKESKIFPREQAERTLQHYPTINESNYQNIEILIQNELENIEKLEEALLPEQEQLKTTGDLLAMTEKVIGGTYVQSLVREEKERIFRRTPDSAAEFLTHLNVLFTMSMRSSEELLHIAQIYRSLLFTSRKA